MSDTWASCGCLPGVRPGSVSTLTHLGKIFGLSVGWFGGWAKSYVQVEYANMICFITLFRYFINLFILFIAFLFLYLRDADSRKDTLCPFCVPIHEKKEKKNSVHRNLLITVGGNILWKCKHIPPLNLT